MLMWLPKYLFAFRDHRARRLKSLRPTTSTRFFVMDANNKCSETLPVPATKKKPYVKPSFRCEKVFETNAVGCGKTPTSSFQYNIDPKAS
jgi:hypothetical protein